MCHTTVPTTTRIAIHPTRMNKCLLLIIDISRSPVPPFRNGFQQDDLALAGLRVDLPHDAAIVVQILDSEPVCVRHVPVERCLSVFGIPEIRRRRPSRRQGTLDLECVRFLPPTVSEIRIGELVLIVEASYDLMNTAD